MYPARCCRSRTCEGSHPASSFGIIDTRPKCGCVRCVEGHFHQPCTPAAWLKLHLSCPASCAERRRRLGQPTCSHQLRVRLFLSARLPELRQTRRASFRGGGCPVLCHDRLKKFTCGNLHASLAALRVVFGSQIILSSMPSSTVVGSTTKFSLVPASPHSSAGEPHSRSCPLCASSRAGSRHANFVQIRPVLQVLDVVGESVELSPFHPT